MRFLIEVDVFVESLQSVDGLSSFIRCFFGFDGMNTKERLVIVAILLDEHTVELLPQVSPS